MTAICHCKNCQRQTGTAFSIIVGLPEDSLVFSKSDTLTVYLDHGKSGRAVQRKFCNNCGSPILSITQAAPGLSIIKAGTLNDKSWLKPTTQFWCSTSQPWLDMSDELTKYDENP